MTSGCVRNFKRPQVEPPARQFFNYKEWLDGFLFAAWQRDFSGRESAWGAGRLECGSYNAWRRYFCKSLVGQAYLTMLNSDGRYTEQRGWDDCYMGRRVGQRGADK